MSFIVLYEWQQRHLVISGACDHGTGYQHWNYKSLRGQCSDPIAHRFGLMYCILREKTPEISGRRNIGVTRVLQLKRKHLNFSAGQVFRNKGTLNWFKLSLNLDSVDMSACKRCILCQLHVTIWSHRWYKRSQVIFFYILGDIFILKTAAINCDPEILQCCIQNRLKK